MEYVDNIQIRFLLPLPCVKMIKQITPFLYWRHIWGRAASFNSEQFGLGIYLFVHSPFFPVKKPQDRSIQNWKKISGDGVELGRECYRPWYLYKMVTQIMLRMCGGNLDFAEVNFKFATAFDQNKCSKQTNLPISQHTCAPVSEWPSNIRNMVVDWISIWIPINSEIAVFDILLNCK